jgi:hypothetical protein
MKNLMQLNEAESKKNKFIRFMKLYALLFGFFCTMLLFLISMLVLLVCLVIQPVTQVMFWFIGYNFIAGFFVLQKVWRYETEEILKILDR